MASSARAAALVDRTANSLLNIFSNPASAVCVIGIIFITIGREAYRYPLVASSQATGATIPMGPFAPVTVSNLINLLALLAVALLCRRNDICGKVFHPIAIIVAGLIMTVGSLEHFVVLEAGAASGPVSELYAAMGYFLFVAWAYHAFRLNRRNSVGILAVAFLVSGVMQAGLAMLQPMIAFWCCSLAPLISMLLLLWYATRHGQDDEFPPPADGFHPNPTTLLKANSEIPWLVSTFLCFACFGAISYILHNGWTLALATGTQTMTAQFYGAMGVILISPLFLAMNYDALHQLGTVPLRLIIVLLLFVASFMDLYARMTSYGISVLPLLDASHKAILFLAWVLPFASRENDKPIHLIALSLFFYQLGSTAIMLFVGQTFPTFVILTFCLLFCTINLVVQTFSSMSLRENPLYADGDADPDMEQAYEHKLKTYEDVLFSVYISEAFNLTKREYEVAALLARGMTNREVADELVISFETAKTHRRNMFQKMQVRSIDELSRKLQAQREDGFKDYMKELALRAEAEQASAREDAPEVEGAAS